MQNQIREPLYKLELDNFEDDLDLKEFDNLKNTNDNLDVMVNASSVTNLQNVNNIEKKFN